MLRYLKAAISHGLLLQCPRELSLCGFADVNWVSVVGFNRLKFKPNVCASTATGFGSVKNKPIDFLDHFVFFWKGFLLE